MDERVARTHLRDDIRRYEAPRRHLAQVIRRAGRFPFLRAGLATAVGGLMIVGVAGPLLVLSSIRPHPSQPASTEAVHPAVTAEVAVGDFPSAITTGDGGVWVAVQSRAGGEDAVGDGSLWIGLPEGVQRVDPDSGGLIAEIPGVGGELTFSSGAAWAVASATEIARIDPSTNQVVAMVSLGLPGGGDIIRGPVGTADSVWVIAALEGDGSAVSSGQLLRIDPITNSVVARIDLEVASSALAVGDGAAWVVRWGADRTYLTRIDMRTNRPDVQLVVEGGWTPFAVGAGRLWLEGGMAPEIRLAWLNHAHLRLEGSLVVATTLAFEGSGVFDPETDSDWVAQYEDSVTRIDVRATQSAPPPLTRGLAQFDPEDGIWILTSPDWSFVAHPSGPGEPKTLFAMANYPMERAGECAPTRALEALPPNGALAWVLEYHATQGSDFPARPDRFALDPSTLANYECSGIHPTYMFRFQDAGRYFQVDVAFGDRVGNEVRDEMLSSLSSLLVDRCPPAQQAGLVSEFGTLSTNHRSPGENVTLSGPTGRDENWFWASLEHIEVWWSLKPVWVAEQKADKQLLASVDPGKECSFGVTFPVPDVPPGKYVITVLGYWDPSDPGASGFGLMGERAFTVASSSIPRHLGLHSSDRF